jgi:hypothetical protein
MTFAAEVELGVNVLCRGCCDILVHYTVEQLDARWDLKLHGTRLLAQFPTWKLAMGYKEKLTDLEDQGFSINAICDKLYPDACDSAIHDPGFAVYEKGGELSVCVTLPTRFMVGADIAIVEGSVTLPGEATSTIFDSIADTLCSIAYDYHHERDYSAISIVNAKMADCQFRFNLTLHQVMDSIGRGVIDSKQT